MIFSFVYYLLINSETQPFSYSKNEDSNNQTLELAIPFNSETTKPILHNEYTSILKEHNIPKDKEKVIKENHVNSNKSKLKIFFHYLKI